MLNVKKYDFLIIGAGIVGLSVAKELILRFPAAKIAIIEKEQQIGMHASGRNSGVLHSGIYYPQDSLKAKFCAEGAKRMLLFAKEHQIPHRVTGKIIIATSAKELVTLNHLLKNASNNQINAQAIDEKTIKEIEPYATPYQRGIHIPGTANIDSKLVLKTLYDIVIKRKVAVYLGQEVIGVTKNHDAIITSKEPFHYGYLFNCAGANTDKIAKLFGLAAEYRLLPFKGIYYKLSKEKKYLINGNIYPVPDLNLPFLGIHFTKTIHNDVYVGPTAIPAFGRENYGLIQGISIESIRILKDISFMYLTNHQQFRQLIHTEMKKYIKHHFLHIARQLVASLQMTDLISCDKVGIRPQLINIKKRKLEMDYIIEQGKNSIHVLNAISPAFTSAFCFAELLVNRIQDENQDVAM